MMIMNRIIVRYVLFSVPVIILILLLFKDRLPFGGDNSSFAAEPKKEITRIEFSDGEKKLFLEKNIEGWLVNGKYETRKNSILFILKVLTEIKIKSPVTSEFFNNEIIVKGIIPVRVKVFEQRKIIKSFIVYKTGSNTYGNIMKVKEGSKPFIVYIPGYEGEIGSAFTLNELFWQPYTILNFLPSQILSVTMENMVDPGSSFSIKNENHRFFLSDLTGDLSGWDTSRIVRYLSYFTHVPFESWAFEISPGEKKKIEAEQPVYRITINPAKGEKIVLTLWERFIDENDVKKKDSDRLWAKTEARDELFIVRYFDIDPVLKKRSYFFPE